MHKSAQRPEVFKVGLLRSILSHLQTNAVYDLLRNGANQPAVINTPLLVDKYSQ